MTAPTEDPRELNSGSRSLRADEDTEVIVEYVDNRRQRIVLMAILVLLFLLLAGLSTVVLNLTRGRGAPERADIPEGIEWVRTIYGWGSTFETSLDAPSDVAFAPDGTIWAVSGAKQIVGFNPDGSLQKLIEPQRGKEEGMVHTLEGITVGPDGTLYVTDGGKNQVVEFAPDGTWLGEWGVQFPIEIALDGPEKIVVTGPGGFAIVNRSPIEVISQWGSRGRGEGEFDLPHGVVVGDDGTIYISDSQNKRVVAYDQRGTLKWSVGGVPENINSTDASATTPATPFQLPSGITIDGNGRLVLVDAFEFAIFVLDPEDGTILARYGDYGELDGSFGYPTGIDYDPDRDWFAVADTANNRVQIIRIPDSGGSALAPVNRALSRPIWLFCLPLLLLVGAAVVSGMRRRRERAEGGGSALRQEV